MRVVIALAAVALSLVVASPAVAQEFRPPSSFFAQPKRTPKPPAVDWSWRPPVDRTAESSPSIVCGMTLVPADPKVDPKIRVAVPRGNTAFTMRSAQPPICKAP